MRLGIILVVVQSILVASIPVFVKLFPPSCNSFICIFSPEQGYFFYLIF